MRSILAAIAGVCLLCSPVVAQEPQPWRGIMCNAMEQIKDVVRHGSELGGAQAGFEAVNEQAGDTVCRFITIVGIKGPDMDLIDTPEGVLAVIPFLVVTVGTPLGPIMLPEPVTWWTLGSPQVEQRGA